MISRLSLPRWHDVLLEIHKARDNSRYCEKLNRRVQASLTHMREIVRLLADHHLIEIVPNGKTKALVLTEKGKTVALLILSIKSELSSP